MRPGRTIAVHMRCEGTVRRALLCTEGDYTFCRTQIETGKVGLSKTRVLNFCYSSVVLSVCDDEVIKHTYLSLAI